MEWIELLAPRFFSEALESHHALSDRTPAVSDGPRRCCPVKTSPDRVQQLLFFVRGPVRSSSSSLGGSLFRHVRCNQVASAKNGELPLSLLSPRHAPGSPAPAVSVWFFVWSSLFCMRVLNLDCYLTGFLKRHSVCSVYVLMHIHDRPCQAQRGHTTAGENT